MVKSPRAEELLESVAPTLAEDILLALRYHYYVKARSLVPDNLYDAAEREFRERPETDEFSSPVNLPGSDNAESYTDQVKALALYLSFVDHQKKKEFQNG